MAFVKNHLIYGGGTSADEAHVTHQHIPELGKFIQAGAAEELTDTGDAGIVFVFEDAAFGLVVDQMLQFVRIGNHGAEFPDPEGATFDTAAQLTVEDGTRIVELDGDRDGDKDDRGEG